MKSKGDQKKAHDLAAAVAKIGTVLSLWEPKDQEQRELRALAERALEDLKKLLGH